MKPAPVELTAVPASGWVFSNWSGDLSGSDNPVSVTVNADMNITATFVELPSADNFVASLTSRTPPNRPGCSRLARPRAQPVATT